MSQRLSTLKADEVIRALEKAGFEVTRIKGSHHIMRHIDDPSRGTVVPVHSGKDIKRGLLRKIIADAGLTADEFKALLRNLPSGFIGALQPVVARTRSKALHRRASGISRLRAGTYLASFSMGQLL
jgi:predicted RNA binding protein YcfA (HicA-like mRNA interferase family)